MVLKACVEELLIELVLPKALVGLSKDLYEERNLLGKGKYVTYNPHMSGRRSNCTSKLSLVTQVNAEAKALHHTSNRTSGGNIHRSSES